MTKRSELVESLRWKKFELGSDGFVSLVDVMGDDSSVVQAARVSYGNELQLHVGTPEVQDKLNELYPDGGDSHYFEPETMRCAWSGKQISAACEAVKEDLMTKDRTLIRYLMSHRHSTPFEMAEVKFVIQIPMDAWRQFVRHRTLSINEYSTRYTEAIDSMATTKPDEWRLQSGNNKQGSDGYLREWPDDYTPDTAGWSPGDWLSYRETQHHENSRRLYEERLRLGVAREQARKDLPLSNYTRAYIKNDLHNWMHFLGLRMDAHAQLEIREFASVIGEQIIKPLFPLVWEAFEDFRLGGMFLSRLDTLAIQHLAMLGTNYGTHPPYSKELFEEFHGVPQWQGLKRCRERDECLQKLQRLGLVRTA